MNRGIKDFVSKLFEDYPIQQKLKKQSKKNKKKLGITIVETL